MPRAFVTLDRDFTVGPVSSRLCGSLVEHMGRGVYTGIYEPGHPTADRDGLRQDVLSLVRDLGPTVVRYPGGNFVSGYEWEDGVGPREQRPSRLVPAWHTIETNEFGIAEFSRWAKLAGVETMMALNLGTRGIANACDLLEYCNHPGGSKFSDLRRSHGMADPLDIRLWCLGNEMDAPWQLGHKNAHEYGRLAAETGRAMRMIDPRVELVACGSSGSMMTTFGEWERIVLEEAYDQVDYISAHAYYEETDGDLPSFLASAVDMDNVIDSVIATADSVRAAGRHTKRINISFDEWNVWYAAKFEATRSSASGATWEKAPRLIEDEYSVTDAVVVGTMLNSLLRHCDRVTIACQAQLVNVIGLLRTEPGGSAWKQAIAYPFEHVRRLAVGESLRVRVRSDRQETKRFGDVDTVDVSATWDETTGALTLFVVNRDPNQPTSVDVRCGGFGDLRLVRADTLHAPNGADRHAVNSREYPNHVKVGSLSGVCLDGQFVRLMLPPLSWNVIQLSTKPLNTL